MTQENKDLLIKDLSARVPYGVKFVIDNGLNNVRTLTGIGEDIPYEDWQMCAFARGISAIPIEYIKPYLFPLSSISEEQKKYISDRWGVNEDFDFEIDPNWGRFFVELGDAVGFINWCYENHFDINGLIPKGSALDATGLNIY